MNDFIRQIGWATKPARGFVCLVRRVAVRCPEANGQWGIDALICSLSSQDIIHLVGYPPKEATYEQVVHLIWFWLYNQGSGGSKMSLKSDKYGLGLTKLDKKRIEAQKVLMLLSCLLNNVVVWIQLAQVPRARSACSSLPDGRTKGTR